MLDIKFVEAFQGFIEGLRAQEVAASVCGVARHAVGYDEGRRYIRVWKDQHGAAHSKFSHCFVDKSNGDVLKCEGWKKPAKHARGNIFSPENGMEAVNLYGANCL